MYNLFNNVLSSAWLMYNVIKIKMKRNNQNIAIMYSVRHTCRDGHRWDYQYRAIYTGGVHYLEQSTVCLDRPSMIWPLSDITNAMK